MLLNQGAFRRVRIAAVGLGLYRAYGFINDHADILARSKAHLAFQPGDCPACVSKGAFAKHRTILRIDVVEALVVGRPTWIYMNVGDYA